MNKRELAKFLKSIGIETTHDAGCVYDINYHPFDIKKKLLKYLNDIPTEEEDKRLKWENQISKQILDLMGEMREHERRFTCIARGIHWDKLSTLPKLPETKFFYQGDEVDILEYLRELEKRICKIEDQAK